MADISVQKKDGADLTWVWATAAIIAILGLMFWLFTTQDETTSTAVMPDAEETVAEAPPTGETVQLAAVGAAPDQFLDRQLRIENVPVAARLGNRGFWADVPGANPFLVVLGPSVTDVSWVEPGESATVVGAVQPVTEAELDSWIQGNVLQPDARAQAAFATHYLMVSDVVP